MIRFTILSCLLCLVTSFVGAQGFWTAEIEDATAQDCNNGSIDLTPPNCPGTFSSYTYKWTKTGSSFVSTSQDVSSLSAGQYTVKIKGPLCLEREFTYEVLLKDYNFKIEYVMPNDCEPDKPGPNSTDNGLIKISWNENISPEPVVTNYSTGVLVGNDVWISDLSSGMHRFHFSVGESCEWFVDQRLCCCSVTEDYDINEGDAALCEGLADGIAFSIDVLDVVGASTSSSEDGSIRVRVTSPGPNMSVTWTSARPEYQNRILYQHDVSELYSGEYCYTYTDDCHVSGITGCVVVDDCENAIGITDIIAAESSCFGSSDGSIYLELATTMSNLREFTIHSIQFDGSIGAELQNAESEITPEGTFVNIFDLRPGEHTFRIVTEQYCEGDITFTIEETISELGIDSENCTYLVYCGGEVVRRERVSLEPVPSEYCYITQLRCPITDETTDPVSTFNEELISNKYFDLDAGTCWVGYPCEDGRIDGEIAAAVIARNCNGVDELPAVSFTRFCKLNSPSNFDIVVDLGVDPVTVHATRISEGDCGSCKSPADGRQNKYEATNPFNDEIVEISCCRQCGAKLYPRIVSVNSSNVNDCLNSKNGSIVNSATGHSIVLSNEEIMELISTMEEFGSVNSSTTKIRLVPGLYFLTTSKCAPARVIAI